MRPDNYINFHDFIMKLQRRVHLLIALPILIFILLFLKIENTSYRPFILDKDLLYLLRTSMFFITIGVIIFSLIYFTVKIKQSGKLPGLRTKLDRYFSFSIIRDYLLTAILVINLTGMILTADRFYVIFFSITLVVMLSGYPSHSRIINALNLNQEETELAMSKEPMNKEN